MQKEKREKNRRAQETQREARARIYKRKIIIYERLTKIIRGVCDVNILIEQYIKFSDAGAIIVPCW